MSTPAQAKPIDRSVEETMSLLRTYGREDRASMRMQLSHSRPLNISPLEHSLEAARLASEAGFSEEVEVAALLHDCGHFVAKEMGSVTYHTLLGSSWLRERGFSPAVCELVARQNDANRYMCYADPAYYTSLSAAAKVNVEDHGGPMSSSEAAAFRCHDVFKASMLLKRCCEAATTFTQEPKSLRKYRSLLEDHLGEHLCDRGWWEFLGEPGTYHVKR